TVRPLQLPANLDPGMSVSIPVLVAAPAGDPPAGPITVQIEMSATDPVSGVVDHETSTIVLTLRPAVSTPVLTPASLSVGVNPGKSLSRRFRLRNAGYMAMANATVSLQDPATFSWVTLGNAR